MTLEPFDYDTHRVTFERLRHELHAVLNAANRAFLLSFEAGERDYALLTLPGLQDLPGVQWQAAQRSQAQAIQFAQARKIRIRCKPHWGVNTSNAFAQC